MKRIDLIGFRQAIQNGQIEWRKHVLQRLAERDIMQSTVLDLLLSGERIEEYSTDKPFPSALFLGYSEGKPFHVVAAFDEANARVYIITAYQPSLDVFEADYKTRRK